MTDDEVIVQAQRAESEAQRRILFNELVPRFRGIAYRYAYAMLGDVQLAEDAAQEGLLAAYQLLSQLREPQAFAVWLQRIVHTHCRRLLYHERNLTRVMERSEAVDVAQPSPHATLEYSELQQAIQATIKSLPKSQQAPVTLYYLDNYSQAEIAQTLNLSLAAVKKRRGLILSRHKRSMRHYQGKKRGGGLRERANRLMLIATSRSIKQRCWPLPTTPFRNQL